MRHRTHSTTPLRLVLAFVAAFALVIGVAAGSASAGDDPVVTADASAKIDINSASASELTALKGIGKKKAQAIVDYRTANGPFQSVDDLTKVKGIGQKTLDKLRDSITVGEGDAAAAGAVDDAATGADDTGAGADDAREDPGADIDAPAKTDSPAPANAGGGIDINKASASDLTSLPGIGKSKAQAIVDYRTANGPFKSVDDLTKVKGIGAKTLAKFRDQVTVGGE